ncbi:MAG: MFS transporter [Clostridia bacterium]|nr:MFS transporter [Clostridia bacterium]
MAKGNGKVKAFFKDMKEHWSTPAPGKYVPYKEYFSIFGAVGGNYALSYVNGFLGFGTGCYLVAFYYQIPILTFSAIGTFFMATGYLWSILGMGIDANLGFLPKKTQAKYFAVYLSFAALGLVLMIFDLSRFLPEAAQRFLDTRWSGLNAYNIFKIFGIYFFCNGWGGFRSIVIRRLLLKKFGRYKLFAYANVVQCLVFVLLICWLPLYKLPMTERVWKLYLLFSFYGMFGIVGSPQAIADNISPDQQERLLVRSFPVKLSHLMQNLINFLMPTIAGALFVDGITDLNTFKYLIPIFYVLCTVIMFLNLNKIHERIPAPPIEKKPYYDFWTCIGGIFKNKYLWINNIAGLLDSLGNGMLNMKTVLLIYTWREKGLFFSIAEILLKFAGTPGQLLAPWIRKRFQYKTLMVFKQIILAVRTVIYALAFLFLGKVHFLGGLVIFITYAISDGLKSAVEIAQNDMGVRVSDYQMYISGERFEGYQGIIGWFTGPISSLISLIIPIMFVGVGFTSDWDVLYVDDVRVKCMLIGLFFDFFGYLLIMIPYIFFWDYSDEKHQEVMKELQERAERLQAETDADTSGEAADGAEITEPVSSS